jgi:hypothetical protein
MEAGRIRSNETRMKGTINQDNKLTDIYLPRKCDYTDRSISSKDYSSVQISVADVPFFLFRSMTTELSTLAKAPLLLSLDTSDPLEKETQHSRKSSRKRNLSDRT